VRFSRKRQDVSAQKNFFQDLRENTCSLRPALKSVAPGFKKFQSLLGDMSGSTVQYGSL